MIPKEPQFSDIYKPRATQKQGEPAFLGGRLAALSYVSLKFLWYMENKLIEIIVVGKDECSRDIQEVFKEDMECSRKTMREWNEIIEDRFWQFFKKLISSPLKCAKK